MNPYLSVWFKPQDTIDKVINEEIEFKFYIPILLASASIFLRELDYGFGVIGTILFIIFGIALGYLIGGYISPWIMLKIGQIWKGRANLRDLQNVFGLSLIPLILIYILQLLNLTLGEYKSPYEVNQFIQFTAWVFQMRILIFGLSRVQKFSFGLVIVNLIISVLPFFLLQLIFYKG